MAETNKFNMCLHFDPLMYKMAEHLAININENISNKRKQHLIKIYTNKNTYVNNNKTRILFIKNKEMKTLYRASNSTYDFKIKKTVIYRSNLTVPFFLPCTFVIMFGLKVLRWWVYFPQKRTYDEKSNFKRIAWY